MFYSFTQDLKLLCTKNVSVLLKTYTTFCQVCPGAVNDDHYTEEHCEYSGDFFILGGAIEMPWAYNRPYYFEITKTVLKLNIPLDSGQYHVEADIFHINGTQLPSDALPHPFVHFRPAVGSTDRKFVSYKKQ